MALRMRTSADSWEDTHCTHTRCTHTRCTHTRCTHTRCTHTRCTHTRCTHSLACFLTCSAASPILCAAHTLAAHTRCAYTHTLTAYAHSQCIHNRCTHSLHTHTLTCCAHTHYAHSHTHRALGYLPIADPVGAVCRGGGRDHRSGDRSSGVCLADAGQVECTGVHLRAVLRDRRDAAVDGALSGIVRVIDLKRGVISNLRITLSVPN
jgi:hypothetical protein